MKQFLKNFVKQGLVAAWCGPVVMAIIYAILGGSGAVETLTVKEACMGIISSTIMAFIAAGIPVVYKEEKLPLPTAILIHAGVLYLDYLIVYLMNGWLKNSAMPILIFTTVFFAGFALIWFIIWQVTRRQVKQMNSKIQPE